MSNCNCHTAFPFSTCNPSIASSLVYYSGPNLPCSGINNKDSITIAIQKIDAQLCGENLVNNVFSAILNDAELYQQFVDLVNGAIDCSTILACLTTTTTTSSTSSTTSTSTTTSTTTACPYPNLIVNGDFTDDLTGWNNTAFEWSWNADHGGSAFFGGQDNISNLLFQEVLTVGQSYDITFTLFNFAPCTEFAYLNVHVGDTIYGPITYSGTTIINLTITCTGSEVFGFQGYDACGEEVGQHIFVNNVTVNQHCSNFITTTTTTTSP